MDPTSNEWSIEYSFLLRHGDLTGAAWKHHLHCGSDTCFSTGRAGTVSSRLRLIAPFNGRLDGLDILEQCFLTTFRQRTTSP